MDIEVQLNSKLVFMNENPRLFKRNEIVDLSGVSYGSCVIAIVKIAIDSYAVGHFSPGNIVKEVSAMIKDSIEINPVAAIYETGTIGDIECLYQQGNHLGRSEISRRFKQRDLPYSKEC